MKNKAFLCAPRRFLIITVVYLLIQSVGIYLFFESLQYEEIGHLEAILNIIAPPAPLWIAAFFRRYDWLSIVRLHEDKIVLWAMFTRRSRPPSFASSWHIVSTKDSCVSCIPPKTTSC